MIRLRLRLAALALAFASALASTMTMSSRASAQDVSTVDEATRQEARGRFADGERAFAEGDARAALAHFERAFELVAHDAVRFNIAVCLEALGRHAEALAQYRAAAASQTLSADERARAVRGAQTASLRVGVVRVAGGAGAMVSVDGRARCAAPCRVEVDPGAHDVTIADRSHPRALRIDARAGEEVVVTDTPVAPVRAPVPVESTYEPGWLTWTGAGVGVVGVAGVIGFGLHAEALHDEYERAPTREGLDDGEAARNLANAAIGVAALGAVLVAIDLVFIAPGAGRRVPRTAHLDW